MLVILKNEGFAHMEAIADCVRARTYQRSSSPAANEGDRDVFYVVILLCGLGNGCLGWEVSSTHTHRGVRAVLFQPKHIFMVFLVFEL